jgi:hypothetical protein
MKFDRQNCEITAVRKTYRLKPFPIRLSMDIPGRCVVIKDVATPVRQRVRAH